MKSIQRKLLVSWESHTILSMTSAKAATDIVVKLSLAVATNMCLLTEKTVNFPGLSASFANPGALMKYPGKHLFFSQQAERSKS